MQRASVSSQPAIEPLESRKLLAFDLVAAYTTTSGAPFFINNGASSADVLTTSPQEITLRFSPGTVIDPDSLAAGIAVTRSGRGGDAFGTSGTFADQVVQLGSVTVNDVPNQNEVVLRFAETLPDDSYRITIKGDANPATTPIDGLQNVPTPPAARESFFSAGTNSGTFSFSYRVELGAHVKSVVPQPVIRAKTIDFKALPADGDLLTIAIRGGRRVFEFDSGSGVQPGNAAISLAGATVNSLAIAVRDAINALSTAPGFNGEISNSSASASGSVVTFTGTSFTPIVSVTRGSVALADTIIKIGDGALSHLRDKVVVYFNANDPLASASAQNPANYQLFETHSTTAQSLAAVTPTSVSYEPASATAVLTFATGAVADDKLYRLQIGNAADANNTLATAVDVGAIFLRPGSAPAYATTARIGDGSTGANDVDLYKVRLTAGGTISLTAAPQAGLDVALRLFDSAGAPITSGNGFTVTTNGPNAADTLSYSPTAGGVFFIGVSSAGNVAYSAIDGSNANGGTTTGSYIATITSTVPVATSDENSSYTTATPLGVLGVGGSLLEASIQSRPTVATPAGDLPFPDPPGALDAVGQRDIPVQQHGRPGVGGASAAQPIPTRYYNFASVYGVDPQNNTLFNAITETQKQRAREIFDLYSRVTGIRFVESADLGMQIVTGDMRALSPTINTAPAGLAVLGGNLAIMDATENWGDSEYGGYWFQVAMHEIGHNLGLEHSYDLPSIMGAGESPTDGLLPTEPVFPGNYDIEHALQIVPRSGTDIDIYSFQLDADGRFSAETRVARPGQPLLFGPNGISYLDTVITLYREVTAGGVTTRELVARNDDYFGRDSFVGLDLLKQDALGNPYTYYVAVTSTGNTNFDPAISNSGAGGRSEGDYRLEMNFVPTTGATATATILDTQGTKFDGDRDGVAGGAFDFWFNTAASGKTVYVDKAGPTLNPPNGSLANPFTTIAAAITAVNTANAVPGSKMMIRIVGNDGNAATLADDRPYLIGRAQGQTGTVLQDGATFNVPKGVTAIIDEGAILKLRGAIIDVGSSSLAPSASRAGAALQVLGTPAREVRFTSYHDDNWGGDSDLVGPAQTGGQWGGIVLRQDSDVASKRSFVNAITNAQFRYGGGQVLVDSQLKTFTPVQIESTRPTVAFNTITQSAGAAISADPNAFDDSNGRIGPELRGNLVTGNSINGVFIGIDTASGSTLTKLTVPARFKSTDIVYVIQQNLVIDGGAGGYESAQVIRRTGNTAVFLSTITGLASTADLAVGMEVYGPSLPASGAKIASISSATSITLSTAALDTVTAESLTFVRQASARATGRLTIDPGVVVKLSGSRIELERGSSRLYAEGLPGSRVIFTSLADHRFGAGGTFDTNGNQPDIPSSGNWAGIVLNAGAAASIDRAYIGFGGGTSTIEGTISRFNVVEAHQAELRLANSRVENNAAGFSAADGIRTGRGINAAATMFVRGAQPIVVGNDFRDNLGTLISINANALDDSVRGDTGRSTGAIERFRGFDDNFGPLVRNNRISYAIDSTKGRPAGGAITGMDVRGEELTVEGVWDDTDIVHVLTSQIQVRNFHTATGLRLLSRSNASLVVKAFGDNASLVASGVPLDIDDRIGGTVQVIGQPGYPVVMTSLRDDSVYASLDALGRPNRDTNTDASVSSATAGDWRGLRFLEWSNDRNVSVVREAELAYTSAIDVNALVDSAQTIGTLAPNFAILNGQGTMNSWESAQEKSGDENRRLGFEVHGTVAFDDPTDVDVYGFSGYAGSEVWIDVDKTSPGLDAMLELVDANGKVLARSVDSLNDIGVVTAANPEICPEASTSGSSRSYQLAPPAVPPGTLQGIIPGTLSGVVYVGNTAVQTFTVDRAGVFAFTKIGDPVSEAIGGVGGTVASLNRTTGVVTLPFDVNPVLPTRIEVSYEFSRLPLATLGFDAVGDQGAYSLVKDEWRGNDHFSMNPRDPGMRLTLPGTVGDLNQYFIRVRSQPRYDGSTTAADYATRLESSAFDLPGNPAAGVTSGRYELRVRLRQQDEKPGSAVRYADIRYPVTGIEVFGLPRSSPLVGENGENTNGANDTFAAAQQLGNLLTTDRNTISVAGELSDAKDLDWYTFTLDYDLIQAIGGVNGGGKTWSTLFDIDYADGFRGNLTLSVFDALGRLLYVGRDSDVADDQPAAGQGNDFDDLSRGSVGKLDPFIGAVQLPTGTPGATTRYYVAVSSNERLPTSLDAHFKASAFNPLIRLEPINSLRRVVEDHIGLDNTGYIAWDPLLGAETSIFTQPTNGAVIDTRSPLTLSANVRPFTLSDVTLFVSTASHIFTADAYRGGTWETRITGNTPYVNNAIADLDMRTDGTLMMYQRRSVDDNNNGIVYFVNPADGTSTQFGGDGIRNDDSSANDVWQITGQNVDAFAIRRTDVAKYESTTGTNGAGAAIVYSIRDTHPILPGTFSYIYSAQDDGSAAMSLGSPPAHTYGRMGYIDTTVPGISGFTTGLQFRSETGSLYGVSTGGQFFKIAMRNATAAVLNTAIPVTDVADFSSQLNPGESFQGLATGPVNLENGRFAEKFFAITSAGRLFCIDPDGGGPGVPALMANVFDTDLDGYADSPASSAITSLGASVTGLAFSPLDINLWHPTSRRGDLTSGDSVPTPDPGHGVNGTSSVDNTRPGKVGGTSMYFGLENWDDRINGYAAWTYGGPGQYGTANFANYDWQRELTAPTTIGNNYNLPGGAYGSLITNSFSLAGYTYTDKPTLYFNYFLQSENASGRTDANNTMRDSARVFVSTDDGLTWTLLATNNQARSDNDGDGPEAELPNTLSASSAIGLQTNQHVQELFDTADWRQARVDLGKWAGESNIKLRFDFSTAGEMDDTDRSRWTVDTVRTVAVGGATTGSNVITLDSVEELQIGMLVRSVLDTAAIDDTGTSVAQRIPAGTRIQAIDLGKNQITLEDNFGSAANVGNATNMDGSELQFFLPTAPLLNDIDNTSSPANTLGSFRSDALLSRQRGADNNYEGFYIDDIIVGFAERGEMVTNATADQTFFNLGTPSATEYSAQVLQGPYQLQIRRGTEYALQPDEGSAKAGIFQLFDTNERLVRSAADTVLTLEENLLNTVDGVVVSAFGSGQIGPDPTFTGRQMSGNGGSTTEHNAIFWSIDLANQPAAFLEFEYQTGLEEGLTPLPGSFFIDQSGLFGDQLPPGDGVAISVDGGSNWTTIASFTRTGGQFRTMRLNLNPTGSPTALTATTVVGFFQSGSLSAANDGGIAVRNAEVTTAPRVATTGLVGDRNLIREQGQFIIEGNIVSNAQQYGIRIDAADRDSVSNAPRPGVPANLPTLNNQRLVPGAVIVNNVIASSGTAGILFSGQTTGANQPPAAVPYGRIVNNTFSGSGSGIGVDVTDNASPTLINNLFANLTTGARVDAGSATAGTVILYSAFWNTATPVAGGSQNDALTLSEDPFVNAANLNFYLKKPGSVTSISAIDSSLDTLQDRNAFVVLKNAIGMSPAPLLAPSLDLFGQLRLDDPDVAGGAPGLGFNVFKDRGAVERADFAQPTASLVTPLDGSTDDKLSAAHVIRLERQTARGLTELVLLLADGGIGIDDSTVTSVAFTLEFRPQAGAGAFTPLVAGTDYLFQYLENTKTVVFQSPSVFALGEYRIMVDNTAATGIRDLAGNRLLNNDIAGAGTTAFTVALVDVPAAPTNVQGTVFPASVALQWTPPSALTGATITGFYVEHSANNGGTWTRSVQLAATATSYTVTGLTNGTAYLFRVAAVNNSGILPTLPETVSGLGAFSAPISVTPLATPTIALQNDTGSSTTDRVTNNGTVTVGLLQANGTWEFSTDSGTTWSLPQASGSPTFVLAAGTYAPGVIQVRQTFPVGNTSQIGSNAQQIVIDTALPSAPTLTLAPTVTDPVSATEGLQPVTVSGESNAAIVVTFQKGSGTPLVKNLTGTGSSQAIPLTSGELTALGDGTITVTATQTDLAGNPQGVPAASLTFFLDTTPPSGAATLMLGPGITDAVSASEATQSAGVVVTSATSGNLIVVRFSRGSAFVQKTITAAGVSQPITLAPDDLLTLGDGLVTVTATQTDSAGNPQTPPAQSLSFTLDGQAPNPVALALGPNITNPVSRTEALQTGGVVTVFGELNAAIVVTLVGSDGNFVRNLTGTGSIQPVTLTLENLATLGDGLVTVTASQTDAAGNMQSAPTAPVLFQLDASAPSSPIIQPGSGVADGATLAEAIQTGGIVTVLAENGAATVVTLTRGPTTVTRSFLGTGSPLPIVLTATEAAQLGNGQVSVTAAQTDPAGNPSATPASLVITLDLTAPSLVISSSPSTLRAGQTATISFALSEASNSFGRDDILVTGGTLSALSQAGDVYTATFTPAPDSTTPGTISVSADTFTDLAGNGNGAAAIAIAIDTLVPTVSIVSSAATLRADQTATISFTLNKPAAAFGAGSVTLSGGTLANFVGSGTSFTATFIPSVPFAGLGSVSVAAGAFADAVGNPNTASALAPPIQIDTARPVVVGFSTTSPNRTYGIGEVIAIVATLSEAVQAGGTLNVTLNTGTTITLTAAGGSTLAGTYVVAAGDTSADLDVVAIVTNGSLLDLAGNPLTSTALPPVNASLAGQHAIVVSGALAVQPVTNLSNDRTRIAAVAGVVTRVPITFSTPVTGVSLTGFRLLLNGRSVSLRGARLTGSGSEYILTLPRGRTTARGIYTLEIRGDSGIRAISNGTPLTQSLFFYWGRGRSVGITPPPKAKAFATLR